MGDETDVADICKLEACGRGVLAPDAVVRAVGCIIVWFIRLDRGCWTLSNTRGKNGTVLDELEEGFCRMEVHIWVGRSGSRGEFIKIGNQ